MSASAFVALVRLLKTNDVMRSHLFLHFLSLIPNAFVVNVTTASAPDVNRRLSLRSNCDWLCWFVRREFRKENEFHKQNLCYLA